MICIRYRPIYSQSAILRGLYRVWGKCDKAEVLSNTKLPTGIITSGLVVNAWLTI